MDIVIITTTVAQSVQRLLAHMRENGLATRQLHCQWRSGPFHAKRAANAAITFMILTAWTPIINRRNYKSGKYKVWSLFYFLITVLT